MLRPVAPRLPAVVLLAALALAGCGDSGPTDEQQIRTTLDQFAQATAAQDYPALCQRILAPKLVDTLEQIGLPCEAALRRGFEGVKQPQISVGEVSVDGDSAKAQVRSSAEGQKPSQDTVELDRVNGQWRISSLTTGSQRAEQGP
jgi:hypothetical protein